MVLLHGLAVNASIWSIPQREDRGQRYRSLSQMLRERGLDVWMFNWRGHGLGELRSVPAPDDRDWNVDHFIHFDLPAIVDHVQRCTGRRPVLVGSSMGAMALAAWLSGAALAGPPTGPRVVVDDQVAAQRQARIAGGVLLEFPAALRWPRSLYDDNGRLRWRELFQDGAPRPPDSPACSNYAFEFLSRLGWLEAILAAVGEIRLDWLRPRPERDDDEDVALQRLFSLARRWAGKSFVDGLSELSRRFKGSTNVSPELFAQGLLPAADHLKAGVLAQMGKSVRCGGFVSATGAPDCVYSDHYDRIACPVLVLLGGRDRIANAEVTRAVFFERIRATDKSLQVFDDLAHGDFETTYAATQRVYPVIADWILERRSLAG